MLEEENSKLKKAMELHQDHRQVVKSTSIGIQNEESVRTKYQRELEYITLKARKERLSWADLCPKLKVSSYSEKFHLSQGLKDEFSKSTNLEKIVPYYVILSENHTHQVLNDALDQLRKLHLKKPIESGDEIVSFDKWVESLPSQHMLTNDHFDALKVKYLESKPQTETSQ